MLNLLDLDYNIKEYILSIENVKEHNYFTERRLRQVAIMKDKNIQLRKFGELVDNVQFELTSGID